METITELLKGWLEQYYVTIVVFAGIVMFVSNWIKNLVNTKKTIFNIISINQLISWAVAIIASFAGQLLGMGLFAGLNWAWTLVYGLVVGGFANSLYDITVLQKTIEWLTSFSKKVK